jgi:hypothetical protein
MADNPPVSVEQLEAGLTTIAGVLARHQVKYAIIGGMAAGYCSQPRFAKDVIFSCTCRNCRCRRSWKNSRSTVSLCSLLPSNLYSVQVAGERPKSIRNVCRRNDLRRGVSRSASCPNGRKMVS